MDAGDMARARSGYGTDIEVGRVEALDELVSAGLSVLTVCPGEPPIERLDGSKGRVDRSCSEREVCRELPEHLEQGTVADALSRRIGYPRGSG